MAAILVVEDEPGFQLLLAEALGGAGYEVVPAETCEAGLRLAVERAFDLVLIDYRMPGMSGIDFLRQYRVNQPHTPAVVMTGFAEVPVVVEAMRLGALDFLVKPISIRTLVPVVERWLRPGPPTSPALAGPTGHDRATGRPA
jgi:DNA-binding NtrC family response regulator